MRPRTRCDGGNYSSLCAIRRRSFGTARNMGERPGGCWANGTPSVHPRAFLLGGIHGRTGSHWPGPDNIAAVHRRTDDPSCCGQARPYGAAQSCRWGLSILRSSSPLLKRSRRVSRGCAPLSLFASCPLPGPSIECRQHHSSFGNARLRRLRRRRQCR